MNTPIQALVKIRDAWDDFEPEPIYVPTFKDFIQTILITKLPLFDIHDDGMYKHYSPYLIVREIVRKHPEHILIANEINQLNQPSANMTGGKSENRYPEWIDELQKKWHFLYLFHAIPKKKAT